MKRIKLFGINGCVSMLAFFLCVSFLSCNNEAEVADVPENFSTDLCKLSDNLCQLIATRNHVTRSDKNSTLCIKAAEFDALLLQFVSKYDITSDLTPAEVNALILTEDEWIELMGNEDAFLSYIANNKTAQFQQMFEKMLSGNTNDININSIVRDKSLKLNEKFILAMQLGVAQDTPIDIDIQPTFHLATLQKRNTMYPKRHSTYGRVIVKTIQLLLCYHHANSQSRYGIILRMEKGL